MILTRFNLVQILSSLALETGTVNNNLSDIFMVEQKYNRVGYLILPPIFPVGQNIRCVLHLVGQFFILVGQCLMSDRYFQAWDCQLFDKRLS